MAYGHGQAWGGVDVGGENVVFFDVFGAETSHRHRVSASFGEIRREFTRSEWRAVLDAILWGSRFKDSR